MEKVLFYTLSIILSLIILFPFFMIGFYDVFFPMSEKIDIEIIFVQYLTIIGLGIILFNIFRKK